MKRWIVVKNRSNVAIKVWIVSCPIKVKYLNLGAWLSKQRMFYIYIQTMIKLTYWAKNNVLHIEFKKCGSLNSY